jgi:hypothetical protein
MYANTHAAKFQCSLGVWKVSNKFYFNFQTKSLFISHSCRVFILSQTGVKAIRSRFGAPHCEGSKFKVVNLQANIKRQSMATSSQGGEKKGNSLLKERSPYLLQHAYNPVDW